MENKTNKTKKLIRNFIFFILLIILTFYIVFKDKNILDILDILNNVKKQYVVVAALCMCAYILCDSINIGKNLRDLKEKSSFWKNIKYSLIGFFFSGITPAATGGQPMQIYYMHKDGIKVANATLALLINLTCIQVITISLALFSISFNHQYLSTPLLWLFAIGIMLNLGSLSLLLISITSRRVTKWIIDKAVKVLKFFKVKNVEEKQAKLEKELKTYQIGARYMNTNKWIVIRTLIFTFVEFIAFYSISYFIYLAFGLNQYNIFELTTMQAVLYGTVSGIPSPGAVGVSEGGYMAIYGKIYSESILSSAMLLTRGINFYLFMIISSIVVIVNDLMDKKSAKKEYEKMKILPKVVGEDDYK